MVNDGMPTGFWIELIIIMAIVIFLVGVIPSILRRKMRADKKKWFSYNHINEFHKKGDWMIRIIFIVCSIFFINKPFIVFFITILFLSCHLVFQAYVEWKFSSNRKNYQVSLIEVSLLFVASILVIVFMLV